MKVSVIGAGIVGVAVASYLLRDGHEVILIDRDEPGDGCSKGNAGALSPGSCIPLSSPGILRNVPKWLFDASGPLCIRPSYLFCAIPWLVRFAAAGRANRINALADALRALNRHTFENYAPLVGNAGCTDLIRNTGSLAVFKTEKGLAGSAREWDIRAARQVRQQQLDAGELHELVPGLSTEYRHGILLPDHGFVADPHRLTRSLTEAFVRDGGVVMRAAVKRIEPLAGGVFRLHTDGEPINADKIVLAAGAWSARLLAPLGVSVPLETQRGYHAMVANANLTPALPVVSADAKVYATPMEHGLRFAGTVEFAGLDAAPDYRRAKALIPLAKDMFPSLEIGAVTQWMGHRPCLPDSLPIIGTAPRHPSLILAFGHGHHGMTGASTTGRVIADLIADRASDFDLMPYRANRF
jgi:glycine/D-amino acid oxidase-like deaminating enzyme